MLKQLAYIIAGMFENAANMIYDAIEVNPHAEPELYVSRECLDEMERIARQDHRDMLFRIMFADDNDRLCSMLVQQETKH